MFQKIMAPIDLAHADKLGKALDVAADMAKYYKAELVYVGATVPQPTKIAHNPEEYAHKLATFAEESGRAHGVSASAETIIDHDPTADLDDRLLEKAKALGVDLVVMASHIPGIADHWWPSHGGSMARHADFSVFIVR